MAIISVDNGTDTDTLMVDYAISGIIRCVEIHGERVYDEDADPPINVEGWRERLWGVIAESMPSALNRWEGEERMAPAFIVAAWERGGRWMIREDAP